MPKTRTPLEWEKLRQHATAKRGWAERLRRQYRADPKYTVGQREQAEKDAAFWDKGAAGIETEYKAYRQGTMTKKERLEDTLVTHAKGLPLSEQQRIGRKSPRVGKLLGVDVLNEIEGLQPPTPTAPLDAPVGTPAPSISDRLNALRAEHRWQKGKGPPGTPMELALRKDPSTIHVTGDMVTLPGFKRPMSSDSALRILQTRREGSPKAVAAQHVRDVADQVAWHKLMWSNYGKGKDPFEPIQTPHGIVAPLKERPLPVLDPKKPQDPLEVLKIANARLDATTKVMNILRQATDQTRPFIIANFQASDNAETKALGDLAAKVPPGTPWNRATMASIEAKAFQRKSPAEQKLFWESKYANADLAEALNFWPKADAEWRTAYVQKLEASGNAGDKRFAAHLRTRIDDPQDEATTVSKLTAEFYKELRKHHPARFNQVMLQKAGVTPRPLNPQFLISTATALMRQSNRHWAIVAEANKQESPEMKSYILSTSRGDPLAGLFPGVKDTSTVALRDIINELKRLDEEERRAVIENDRKLLRRR